MPHLLRDCLVIFIVVTTSFGVMADEKSKGKVLFVGKPPDHPYGSHMYLHTCGVLARCVEQSAGLETVVSDGWPKDSATLARVKTVVVYTNPAAEFLLDGEHRTEVESTLKSGVGLVTIHWASSVNNANLDRLGPKWLDLLGGTWVSNVGLSGGRTTLKQLLPEHPVCRGWKEYEFEDEYYLNPVIKNAKPLLQVKEKKGTDVIVAWVYERPDGGRSFATTLGHPYSNFLIADFRRMIVNGILWTAHVDVPEKGASVELSVETLALPPKP